MNTSERPSDTVQRQTRQIDPANQAPPQSREMLLQMALHQQTLSVETSVGLRMLQLDALDRIAVKGQRSNSHLQQYLKSSMRPSLHTRIHIHTQTLTHSLTHRLLSTLLQHTDRADRPLACQMLRFTDLP